MESTRALPLPADDTAPGAARAFVHDCLADDARVDDVVLIASELVTNAVRYGRPPLAIAIEVADAHITVSVTETEGTDEPHLRLPDADRPGGHGLHVVKQLASSCGWSLQGNRIRCWAVVER